MNFNIVVEEVIKEHSLLSNYKLGWKLLLDRDPELLDVIYESNNRHYETLFLFLQHLKVLRLRFICMLQLRYPLVDKAFLLTALNIENTDNFI